MYFNKKIKSINLSNVLISNDTLYLGKDTKVFYDDECYKKNNYHKEINKDRKSVV